MRMDPLKRISQSIIFRKLTGVTLVQVAGAFLGLLSQTVLARILGVSGFGLITYIFSWIVLISLFARLGFDNSLIVKISNTIESRKWSLLGWYLSIPPLFIMASSLLIGSLVLLFLYIFQIPNFSVWAISLLVLLPIISYSNLNQSILIAFKKTVISNIPVLIIRHFVLILVMVLTVVINDALISPFYAQVANAFAFFTGALVSGYWINKEKATLELHLHKSEKANPFRLVAESFPFLIFSGTSILNQHADVLILGVFRAPEEVGIYGAVSKVIMLISFSSIVANITIKPYITRSRNQDGNKELERQLFFLNLFVNASSFVLFMLIVVFGERLLGIFGNDFIPGYNVLLILSFGKLFAVSTGPVGILLMLSGSDKIGSRLELLFAMVNIVLNFALIPFYGITGAAIATVISWIMRNLVMLIIVRKKLKINPTVFNYTQIKGLVNGFKK
ncbi:oligosaccharide flippase family protein [uncultured Imperialibacter sp.]|uniref:oligosaccharide flippase family protein n=2 Tax=Imperialibacter TaxID=1649461 RepID=UPI0030D953EB